MQIISGQIISGKALNVHSSQNDIEIIWNFDPNETNQLADFFIDNADPSYISHSEIIEGRAVNETNWSPRISGILKNDFRQRLKKDQQLLSTKVKGYYVTTARLKEELAGVCNVYIINKSTAIIEDFIVRKQLRGQGIGRRFLEWLEAEFAALDIKDVFLESGANNPEAHAFFHRAGYKLVSYNFHREIP